MPASPISLRSAVPLAALVCLAFPSSTVRKASVPSIQGAAHHSPLAGRRVRTSAVVIAVAGAVATVQDPSGDGDRATSDAVFLELPEGTRLRPGERIEVTAEVEERVPGGSETGNLSITTLVRAKVRVIGRGVPLPRPVAITPGRVPAEIISRDELPVNLQDSAGARANRFDPAADAIDFLESLEGMRVTVPSPVAVAPRRSYGPASSDFVVLAEAGRGVAAGRRTRAGGILLQSGPRNEGSQNSERVRIRLDRRLLPGPAPDVAVGDRLETITGYLRYDYGAYEVAATIPVRVARRRPQVIPPLPRPAPDGRLTIASYNVLNLSAQPEDSAQRALLGRQLAVDLGGPAIVALQEIQDDSGELDDGTTSAAGTLRALAEAVRVAGGPAYAWFDVAPADGRPGGAPGGNIRNAFLYDTMRVRLTRAISLTPDRLRGAGVADAGVFGESRDPLLGEFEARGATITVINNHLTSRYGSTPVFGAVQPFVQAGETERAGQVRALRQYVGHLLARVSSARVVVLGDMNTFEFSDELAGLLPGEPPVLYPLADLVLPGERYTYIFEGNSQALDHAFVTGSLRAGAALAIPHLNVDHAEHGGVLASDHDPILVHLSW